MHWGLRMEWVLEPKVGGLEDASGKWKVFVKLSVCGFNDLGFIGLPYIWDNRQDAEHNIKVRLDRGLATDSFLSLFRDVKVWHVQTTTSDHCALVVECLEHSEPEEKEEEFSL